MHSSTGYSPFETVYGFNPLTPIDLIPLPIDERSSLDGKKRAELIKSIHEKVHANIEKNNKRYATSANKGRKKVIFEPGDWVWLHLRKERFPAKRRSKLQPRGDGPFQVVERINDNAYKLDLPGEYSVSASFNVSDLTPYISGEDSRSNPFEEGGNDAAQDIDTLEVPNGPISKTRAGKIREAMAGLVQKLYYEMSFDQLRNSIGHSPTSVTLLHVKEDLLQANRL